MLFQIPQRYRFSSKSQHHKLNKKTYLCCFRYHKGTDFQANHNLRSMRLISESVVLDTTKVQIFKQITTSETCNKKMSVLFQIPQRYRFSSKSQLQILHSVKVMSCFRYHKGTDFQANHNVIQFCPCPCQLFQIPQRYRFSSKSQLTDVKLDDTYCCFRYHKGTDFQANHNGSWLFSRPSEVVLDTTKVQIFKQITTLFNLSTILNWLFQIPQRYRFSSKSQPSICLAVK